MMNLGGKLFRRWSWAKTGSVVINAGVAAFIVASLMSKWSLAQAQDSQPKALPAETAKQKARTPAAASKVVVPGAGTKVDASKLAKIIDDEVERQLKAEKIPLSPKSDDAEFLRRVYLDLVGVIPPAAKVTEFLKSTDPAKRAKVIDELLADPRFGKQMSEIWSGLMIPRQIDNRRISHAPLQKWLADNFNSDKPLNKIVYELLTSIGEEDKNGAVSYFVGNPTVDKITDNVTRMFMGVQLQCAQCHNHPFTDYKQTEYWGMAQFFIKVRLTANPAKAAKAGEAVGVFESGTAVKGKKGAVLPDSYKKVPAKFLQGEQPKIGLDDPARPVVASWLTSGKNPFFAKAMANRFWYQMFGRGLVNPVDDMNDDNPPTHPELLAALAEQFTANDFDVRYLLRAICNSETYQRTSRPTGTNAEDVAYYSHRRVRVMSPEQLYDSITAAVGKIDQAKGAGFGGKAGKGGAALNGRDGFTNFFRIEEGTDPLEYQMGIPQALRLMNSPQMNSSSQAVAQAMQGTKNPTEIIENLFLRTLSRRPTAQEIERFSKHVTSAADARVGYGDVLWALLNTSEFTLNH
jgi:hypothetical protein